MSSKLRMGWDINKSLKFIQIRYTDVVGKFLARYLSMPADIEDFFRHGIGLDGSSVRGFAHIDDSDLLLLPDVTTARTVPISSKERMIGTVIADVYKGFSNGRLDTDPRYACQRMQKYLQGKNMLCQLGTEVECFVFDDIKFASEDSKHETTIISCEQEGSSKYPVMNKQGYDCPPFQDSLLEFRFEVAEILKKYYAIDVTNADHEVASGGQIEINFTHAPLTQTADNIQMFKDAIRNVAKNHGKIATFMPKPFFDDNPSSSSSTKQADNGSGMHVNVSVWEADGKRNLFYNPDDSYAELSQWGRYFVGGLMEHASSLSAIVAPTINSYQRLIPGFEAPVYIGWARGNRSAVIRVPTVERNSAKSKRIEFRAPDPSANPYLALSAIVAAGMDGISKKIDPGDPVNENIYRLSQPRKRALGIRPLPSTLEQALSALKSDSTYLLKSCFASELLQSYLELKETEIKEGKGKGRSWQIRRYYDV
jgi:glutamine synthetase